MENRSFVFWDLVWGEVLIVKKHKVTFEVMKLFAF